MNEVALIDKFVCSFIKDNVQKANVNGAVIGLSGGIDSSVVVQLASQAIGNKNILSLILPDGDITPKEDIEDAIHLCDNLKIEYKLLYIDNVKKEFFNLLEKTENNLAQGNLVSRIRMCIIYYHANLLKKLVLGTSNKTEISLGYFTKYGDGASDVLPIGDLYKTQVIELAKFLNIPKNIINKKSSARLWIGQQTEEEIGLLFKDIDSILMYTHKNIHSKYSTTIENKFPHIPFEKIKHILYLIEKNKHKQSSSRICNLERFEQN